MQQGKVMLALQLLTRSTRASVGELAPIIAGTIEVVGAISYDPQRARLLRDGKTMGGVCMLSFSMVPKKLTIGEILDWIEQDLCPHLGPYPGPRSIVLFDNMPQHRSNQLRIEAAINARGAHVI